MTDREKREAKFRLAGSSNAYDVPIPAGGSWPVHIDHDIVFHFHHGGDIDVSKPRGADPVRVFTAPDRNWPDDMVYEYDRANETLRFSRPDGLTAEVFVSDEVLAGASKKN